MKYIIAISIFFSTNILSAQPQNDIFPINKIDQTPTDTFFLKTIVQDSTQMITLQLVNTTIDTQWIPSFNRILFVKTEVLDENDNWVDISYHHDFLCREGYMLIAIPPHHYFTEKRRFRKNGMFDTQVRYAVKTDYDEGHLPSVSLPTTIDSSYFSIKNKQILLNAYDNTFTFPEELRYGILTEERIVRAWLHATNCYYSTEDNLVVAINICKRLLEKYPDNQKVKRYLAFYHEKEKEKKI